MSSPARKDAPSPLPSLDDSVAGEVKYVYQVMQGDLLSLQMAVQKKINELQSTGSFSAQDGTAERLERLAVALAFFIDVGAGKNPSPSVETLRGLECLPDMLRSGIVNVSQASLNRFSTSYTPIQQGIREQTTRMMENELALKLTEFASSHASAFGVMSGQSDLSEERNKLFLVFSNMRDVGTQGYVVDAIRLRQVIAQGSKLEDPLGILPLLDAACGKSTPREAVDIYGMRNAYASDILPAVRILRDRYNAKQNTMGRS